MQRQAVERVAIDKSTLMHCLAVAAEKFTQNAKGLRDVTSDCAFITVAASQQLADQFESQSAEALQLLEQIDEADRVELVTEPEEGGEQHG